MLEQPPDKRRAIELCRTLRYMDETRLCADTIEIKAEGILFFFLVPTSFYNGWCLVCQKEVMQAAASTCETERQCVEVALNHQHLQLPAVLEGGHVYVLHCIRYRQ